MNPKILVLVLLAVTAFVQGAIGQFVAPGQPFPKSDIVFMLLGTVLVFIWYRLDPTNGATAAPHGSMSV